MSGLGRQISLPHRPMGRTGVEVSILGIGGWHLASVAELSEARRIADAAIDAGINFFDNAWDYHDGRAEEWMGEALHGKRHGVVLMTKVCTHGRDRHVAMRMIEDSLRRLRTDYLDVWQLHEVIYEDEPDLIFRPGGAIEALAEARQQGKVRFVGFTGHKDPAIHLRMLSYGFPFDTVQLPLNCCDATFRSFEQQVLPELARQGIAALGMKSLGGSGEIVRDGVVTAAEALRYAMSLPVAVTVSGIDSMEVLRQNLDVAQGFEPMSEAEAQGLRERCRAYAADGRWELFKTSTQYDGPVAQEQHSR